MQRKFYIATISILVLGITGLTGRSFRVNEIPNGNVNDCATCHTTGSGGPRNDFGVDVYSNYLDPQNSSGHVQWGPELAAMDSDGDGVSNGEELQDPNGLWTSGQPNPGNPDLVTSPGDPSDFVPVELTSFTAQVIGSKVKLVWRTATELNNMGFDIERSTDNENWDGVAFVEGNGTSTAVSKYTFIDKFPVVGKSFYRIIQRDYDGTSEIFGPKEVELDAVYSYKLEQNYPNPFNPNTTISFNIAENSAVKLNVYSITGELVANLVNSTLEAGAHTVNFDASNLPSGMYIAQIQAGNFTSTRKMMLMK